MPEPGCVWAWAFWPWDGSKFKSTEFMFVTPGEALLFDGRLRPIKMVEVRR